MDPRLLPPEAELIECLTDGRVLVDGTLLAEAHELMPGHEAMQRAIRECGQHDPKP